MFVAEWPVFLLMGILVATLFYLKRGIVGVFFVLITVGAVFIGKPHMVLQTTSIVAEKNAQSVAVSLTSESAHIDISALPVSEQKFAEIKTYAAPHKYEITQGTDAGQQKKITLKPTFEDVLTSGEETVFVRVNPSIPLDLTVSSKGSKVSANLEKLSIHALYLSVTSGDVFVKLCSDCGMYSIYIEAWSTKMIISVPSDAGLRVTNSSRTTGIILPDKSISSGSDVETKNFEKAQRKYTISVRGNSDSIVFTEYKVQ